MLGIILSYTNTAGDWSREFNPALVDQTGLR
jgi:hypothetical protein